MIKFLNVTKKYNDKTILSGLSLEIKKGQLVVLIGLSGCGKTTALKLINRMLKPTSGKILINDEDIANKDPIKLRRNIGYVIQQTGIFPHMTVRDNIEIISKAEKRKEDEMKKLTANLIKMVGLEEEFLDRYPAELSGGQQQRVGVARAFALDPEIILMDEPFSALDPITREGLQDELVKIQSHFKKTIVFVTHDISEAIKIADKICIIDKGRILQYDTPENIIKHPASEFISEFVGENRIWMFPKYIRAKDIMVDATVTCSVYFPLHKCMEKIRETEIDNLMVTEEETNKLLGVISKKQISELKDQNLIAKTVMDTDFLSVKSEDSIAHIIRHMNQNTQSTIPVLGQNGTLKGMITKDSLLETFSRQFMDIKEAI